MKQRKEPLRMCVVTREKLLKKDLVRVVKTPLNEVKVDLTGKANGKGAYLKRDLVVFKKAKKNKVFNKMFSLEVDDSLFDDLEKSL